MGFWNFIKTAASPYTAVYSLDFDGVNEYLISASSVLDETGSDAFSISAWVQPHSTDGTYDINVLSKRLTTGAAGWHFGLTTGSKARQAFFLMRDNAGSPNTFVLTGGDTCAINTWTHVGVTYDGSKNKTGVILYRAGVAVAQESFGASTLTGSCSNASKVTIGASDEGIAYKAHGRVTHIYKFPIALSAAQMAELAATPLINPTSHSQWAALKDNTRGLCIAPGDTDDMTGGTGAIYDLKTSNQYNFTPTNTESGDKVEDVPA